MSKNPPRVPINALDRAIAWVSPSWGAARARDRMVLAIGGYHGADKNRRALTAWNAGRQSADDDTLPDLPQLREYSRDLIRNAPLAAGAMATKVTNIVGTGLRLQCGIDRDILGMSDEQADQWELATEREWRIWANSQNCDVARTLNFAGIQELAIRSALESGDVFVSMPRVDRLGSTYSLALQVVEADRVSNPNFSRDTASMRAGIELDSFGAPIRYHIADHHPGSRFRRETKWLSVNAFGPRTGRRQILHLYRQLRPGQTRGVPDLAPVIELFKQLERYTNAEIDAAVISSFFTVFIRSESGAGLAPMTPATDGGRATDDDFKMGPAAMLDLGPDEHVEFANPMRPNQGFDPFVLAVLRQIGVAIELPFELLVKHFTSSYSAARAALLEAWKFFHGRRRWLAANLCQPVYEAWMDEAVSRGRIVAPGYLNGDPLIRAAYLGCEWVGDARGQIDPVKENQADTIAEDRGWKTAAENTAEKTGGDWERKHRQRAKEVRMRREAGLESESAPPQITEGA